MIVKEEKLADEKYFKETEKGDSSRKLSCPTGSTTRLSSALVTDPQQNHNPNLSGTSLSSAIPEPEETRGQNMLICLACKDWPISTPSSYDLIMGATISD